MKPERSNQTGETYAECTCGWSRKIGANEIPAEVVRYHAIQVHNDVKATHRGTF